MWRPTEVLAAFQQVGFNPSLSEVAAPWGGTLVTVRLDDLDKVCAALNRTVTDLLQAEPLADAQGTPEYAGELSAPRNRRCPGRRGRCRAVGAAASRAHSHRTTTADRGPQPCPRNLHVCRGLMRHTLYLKEFTHRLAAEWLAYRHHRWPRSTTPHLLVSRRPALNPAPPTLARSTICDFPPKGVSLDGLRQDCLLNEAFTTSDPPKLMRLFGVGEKTAVHYVDSAHPEKTSRPPALTTDHG